MTPADKPTSLTLLERVRGRDEEAWRRLWKAKSHVLLRLRQEVGDLFHQPGK